MAEPGRRQLRVLFGFLGISWDKKGCPYALLPDAEFILKESKASLGRSLVQGDVLKDVHVYLPGILTFCVCAHVSPSKTATTVFH